MTRLVDPLLVNKKPAEVAHLRVEPDPTVFDLLGEVEYREWKAKRAGARRKGRGLVAAR